MSSPVPPGLPPQGQPPQGQPPQGQPPQPPPYQQYPPQYQQPYPPQYPQQPLPPAKKSNLLLWIFGGIAVLLLGITLTCGAVGFFVMHQVKKAGFDPDLMKNNPGLAMTKMVAAMNPNAEILSTNDRTGTVTIRDKSSGKTITMKFDPDQKTMVATDENGKEVSVKLLGDGKSSGGIEMQSPEGKMQFGAAEGNQAPAWVPVYPGSTPAGTFSAQTPDGNQQTFGFKTKDAPAQVLAYYQDQLKSNGFTVTLATSGGQGGMIQAEDAAKKRTVVLTLTTTSDGTQASLMSVEKK